MVKTLADPACGTGGILSIAEDYLRSLNPKARLEVFGQELNPETYAICRSDMMLKGQDASHIVHGNSFSEDGLAGQTFDYLLANPPFGVERKKVEKAVKDEAAMLIGVADDGSVHGLESDYATLHKAGKDNRDLFGLHLNQVLINALGETAASTVSTQIHTVDGHDLCRVHVPPSGFPVDAHVKVDKAGQLVKKTAFYVRIGNGTREITDAAEKQKYLSSRWA